jgi:hypothetical protein
MTGAVPGYGASIESVRRHAPGVKEAFDRMYATLLGRGEVSMDVKEAMRLHNAEVNDCGL